MRICDGFRSKALAFLSWPIACGALGLDRRGHQRRRCAVPASRRRPAPFRRCCCSASNGPMGITEIARAAAPQPSADHQAGARRSTARRPGSRRGGPGRPSPPADRADRQGRAPRRRSRAICSATSPAPSRRCSRRRVSICSPRSSGSRRRPSAGRSPTGSPPRRCLVLKIDPREGVVKSIRSSLRAFRSPCWRPRWRRRSPRREAARGWCGGPPRRRRSGPASAPMSRCGWSTACRPSPRW